ncbi:MAG: hypothetical protein K2I78_04295, partial [Clostridia bacterium]|nr:hypothetical protein [Clostridia bacterium]
MLSFYLPNKTAQGFTNVANIESQSTNLGEMLLDGYENDTTGKGKVFNGEIFWELIHQISGVANPNMDTLNVLTSVKTSKDFRTSNTTKDVTVKINGKHWTATYLSTNKNGDPILTLWLATNSATPARWDENYTNSLGKFPHNMYGTSEMRAVTLNNGGGYALNYNDEELTPVNQDENSEWAIYTMDSVKGSLTSFIEVPDNMDWQHNQSAKTSASQSYDYNNDALDAGGSYSAAYNYLTNTTVDTDGYKGWANDRLWLPSIAETGANAELGIWKTSGNQRIAGMNSWSRSAEYSNCRYAYVLNSSGGMSNITVSNVHAVRPAFHLNLKSAAARVGSLGVAEPTNVTAEYTGETLTLADVSTEQKSWYDSEQIELEYPADGMVDAKTYTVTAKIKDDLAADGLTFVGEPGDGETATTRKFNFTITKKKIGVEISTTGGLTATAKAGAVYSGDTGDRAPTFGFTYTSTDG